MNRAKLYIARRVESPGNAAQDAGRGDNAIGGRYFTAPGFATGRRGKSEPGGEKND